MLTNLVEPGLAGYFGAAHTSIFFDYSFALLLLCQPLLYYAPGLSNKHAPTMPVSAVRCVRARYLYTPIPLSPLELKWIATNMSTIHHHIPYFFLKLMHLCTLPSPL